MSQLIHIAEWYFGIDDDFKPPEEKQAFRRQKQAYELEKGNALFEWAVCFSLGDKLAPELAERILIKDKNSLEWLKSKGFPGKYVINSLRNSAPKSRIINCLKKYTMFRK